VIPLRPVTPSESESGRPSSLTFRVTAAGPDDREFLPPEHAHHLVAQFEVGMRRLQHLAGGE